MTIPFPIQEAHREWSHQRLNSLSLFVLAILAALVVGCDLNPGDTLTVVTSRTEIGTATLDDGEYIIELPGVYSYSFGRSTPLNITQALKPDKQGHFAGFTTYYNNGGFAGGVTSSFIAADWLSVTAGDQLNAVSVDFEWDDNRSPAWVDAQTIVFLSNRTGGFGLYTINPTSNAVRRIDAAEPKLPSGSNPEIGRSYPWVLVFQDWPYLLTPGSVYGLSPGLPIDSTLSDKDAIASHLVLGSQGDLLMLRLSGSASNFDLSVTVLDQSGQLHVLRDMPGERVVLLAAGDGDVAFVLHQSGEGYPTYYSSLTDLPGTVEVAIVDLVAATITDVPSATLTGTSAPGSSWEGSVYVRLAPDGSQLMMATSAYDSDGALIGSQVNMVDRNGVVTALPSSDSILGVTAFSLGWSNVAGRLIGRAPGGEALLSWSAADGSGPVAAQPGEGPADKPVGTLGYPWSGFSALPVATTVVPGGMAEVESMSDSGPTNLFITDTPGDVPRRITGPDIEVVAP